MLNRLIDELTAYGLQEGLVASDDEIYVRNRLLELYGADGYEASESSGRVRALHEILADLTEEALERGILEESTITARDLFDTKLMGLLTPAPSVVRAAFKQRYEETPQAATEYYYHLSQATNYIRRDRIAKDEKWVTKTEYGEIDITINLSKPEKDPRDIARAGKAGASGYPSCLLCRENEGYAGHFSHPARQNHRMIPLTLGGEPYYLQYSPYVYYREHCIILNEKHIPMKIDRATFAKLLEFVGKFPHYTAGSNADLPIVGGSILSHDHFQGGNYEFAMARAPYEEMFSLWQWPDIRAGIVRWPMSVIRLQGEEREALADAAAHILSAWRGYTDEEAFIFRETEGTPHNTITPIARRMGELFELDLVLRNNITTSRHPMGVYHPHDEYHHIKKENIGLIEVMGLAVLPARLKTEMALLEKALLEGRSLREDEVLAKHADWAERWMKERDVTGENIHDIVRDEIGKVFAKVLECAGVYKRTPEGMQAFRRFVKFLS